MIEWLNSVSKDWFDYMLLFTVQNTLFVSVILLALYFLKNKSPKLQKMIALSGLIKLFIPPLASLREISPVVSAVPVFNVGNVTLISSSAVTSETVHLNIYSIFLVLWALTAALLVFFCGLNTFRTVQKIKNAKRLSPENFSSSVPIKKLIIIESEDVYSPYIIGLFRYYLVLPRNWQNWSESIRKSVIAHETAHIKEGDQWINLLKTAAVFIHFFNPLVWILIREINYLSEVVCDDYSVAVTGIKPDEYNKHLLTIAQGSRGKRLYEPMLSFSRAHKMIKNRMFYQLKRKDGGVLKKITFKSKLTVTLLTGFLLFVVLQCSQMDSPTKNDSAVEQPVDESGVYKFWAVDKKPVMLKKAVPEYPEEARKNGIQGMVVVTITIDETGHVIDTEIFNKHKRGNYDKTVADKKIVERAKKIKEMFAPSALEAAGKCLFRPALVDGKPVKVTMNIPFAFRLSNPEAFKFAEVDQKPLIIKKVVPEYPEAARKEGIFGNVIVSVTINEEGKVIQSMITKSIPMLDRAAIMAARKCTFKPAIKDGKPVKVTMNIPFNFKLNE